MFISIIKVRFFLIALLFLTITQLLSYRFTHLPLGNISPLFSFGQSIHKQGQFSLREIVQFGKRSHGSRLVTYNNAYYGITNRLTALVSMPIIIRDKIKSPLGNQKKRQGLADSYLRAEYLLFRDKSDTHRYDITTITYIRVPTATVKQRTRLASKAYNFFFGASKSIITPDWYIYATAGFVITTTRKLFKYGNEFESDIGIGRTIFSQPDSYLIIFIELQGIYLGSNTVNKKKDYQTGEFVLYCGPTFRFKKNSWLLQGGIQYPASRHQKFNNDETFNYRAALSASYSF